MTGVKIGTEFIDFASGNAQEIKERITAAQQRHGIAPTAADDKLIRLERKPEVSAYLADRRKQRTLDQIAAAIRDLKVNPNM